VKDGTYSFERFVARRLYYSFDFLPGTEDVVYSGNTSGQFNVWRQGPPRGGVVSPSTQLTGFVEWTVRKVESFPGGKKILAFADKDGDENYQIFTVDTVKGWHSPFVVQSGVRHEYGSRSLSCDGRAVAYGSNERDPHDMDVLVASTATGRTKPLVAGDAYYAFGHWSHDGRRATVIDVHSNEDQDAYVVDVSTGKKRNLTPHVDKETNLPGPWTASGDGFYLIGDKGRETRGLWFVSASTGKRTPVETGPNEVEDVALSPDGRVLAWVENREGYSTIHLVEPASGKRLGAPVPTRGVLMPVDGTGLKFSPNGKLLGCILSTSVQPTEINVMRVRSLDLIPYTDGFIGRVPMNEMVRAKLVRYKSFDRDVPAFLYKPKAATKKKVPMVLSIHGGPESQERPAYLYAGLYQFLLNRGIGVLAPNIRGSIGYGKTYQKLILHDWGGGELKDIESAWRYLQSLDWVEPSRIAVFGGSFGGFATLSAATRIPDAWCAAVDIMGPSNLVTFIKAVPGHWQRMMKDWVGDPDTEFAFLMSRSPITYIGNVKCSMLVIQGAKDPRVVKSESDQFVEKLRSMGRQVEYMVFPDEGHGFTKQKNEFAAYKRITEFLVERLLAESAA
jgi:dipeptidyl aminopeptidase/acylaminoacyl peptidase